MKTRVPSCSALPARSRHSDSRAAQALTRFPVAPSSCRDARKMSANAHASMRCPGLRISSRIAPRGPCPTLAMLQRYSKIGLLTLTGSQAFFSSYRCPAKCPRPIASELAWVSDASPELMRYIIPGAPAGMAGTGSLMLATAASVVRKLEATLVAFWSAHLVTLAGSRIPASIMLTYSSL